MAVLIGVKEGEVEGLSPLGAQGFKINEWIKYWLKKKNANRTMFILFHDGF